MKSTLKIYAFRNKVVNNITWMHYFIAPDIQFAIELARKFEVQHNDRVQYKYMDLIDFDTECVPSYHVVAGHLPIR